MHFAVWFEGMPEGQGRWVLAVDGATDRLLIADDDGSLHWHYLDDCKLVRGGTPDNPALVMAVQPQQQQIAVPNQLRRL